MPVPYVLCLLLCYFMYIIVINIRILKFQRWLLFHVSCLAKKRTARVADENLYSPTQTSSLLQLTNL